MIKWITCFDHPDYEPVKRQIPRCRGCRQVYLQWALETMMTLTAAGAFGGGLRGQ